MFCLSPASHLGARRYAGILRGLTAKKGVAGLLDGFFPWGAMQAVAKGSVFSWGQAQSMNMMRSWDGPSKETKTVMSGGMGGFVQGLAMSPLLLLKTRVMTDPAFRATGGMMATAIASAKVGGRIVATEGPTALFKGVSVFSAKRAADWTTRYLFVIMFENVLRGPEPGAKLSGASEAVSSLAGGALSALVTIPLDVMVATLQGAGSAGKKASLAETFQKQYAAGHLTKGLVARVAHVALTTMLMKNITTAVYDALGYGVAKKH